jgi:acyl dehydratase
MQRAGIFFEDYHIGQTFTTDRRTITEADHVNFTTAFGFFEPLFMDRSYIESHTPYENPIVPGALTFSVAEGLTILSGILHRAGMALLGVDLKILKPVHIGDTIAVAIEVIDRRKTQKPDRGIVTFRNRVSNQDGVDVMAYTVKRMIRRRN